MKHFIFLLLFFTGFILQTRLQAQGSQSNVIDEVVWVVGDDAIFLSDVEKMRLDYLMEGVRLSGDPYCIIPERIAIHKLFLHQAKLDSVEISDSQVANSVERQVQYAITYLGSQEKLEEYFSKSINVYREELRDNIKEQEAVRQVQQSLMKKLKITSSDVRSFYKRIPEDSLPYISTTVEVEIITIEPQISLQEIDGIKSRLRDFTEQITNGEMQFSSLARAYSDDKETAVKGGELGMTGKSSFVPEFAAVAFELNDPRRVSRIVETEYGYHIIKLNEKRGDRINVSHILIRPRVTNEEINNAIQRLDSIRNDIVEGNLTFERGVAFFSADKNTYNNRGLMVNSLNSINQNMTSRTGTPRFEMSELPPEIARTINTMEIGEISKPFTMINLKTNREIVAIVKLKSRTDGHKASLSEDFEALRAMVENEKQEEILNKWIAKKQKETYIRINDSWINCDFNRDGWLQK